MNYQNEMPIDSDYQITNTTSSSASHGKNKIKKRRKRKTPNKNQIKNLSKINFEKFIPSDLTYDTNLTSENNYENYEKDNYTNFDYISPEADRYIYNNIYEKDYNATNNDYDFTIEELFEEMVIKVDDYFQNTINELVDNFCYDLLYILDDSTYIDEIVDDFCEEINDDLKNLFNEINEKDIPQMDFYEEDAEAIFEPFSDPFFIVFLDAHDYSEEPPKIICNKLRNVRAKVSSLSRETRKKLENSYLNLTSQLSQLDEIQNSIDRILIQNKDNYSHLEDLSNQHYKYLCKSKMLEAQLDTISIKSNFFTKTSNLIQKDFDNFTKEDVKTNIQILSRDVQDFLDDQNSFKSDILNKQSQLKKLRNKSNEKYKDFSFLSEIVKNNLDKLSSISSFDLDLESKIDQKSDLLAPKSVQLRSFDESSFLDFKIKCQKVRMDKEKYLDESQVFLNSIKDENLLFNKGT